MNAKQWCISFLASAAALGIVAAGCGDDVTNNNVAGFGGDSGIDVAAALANLGCTAGKKDCVNDTVARVCPADGTAWVAVTCRAGEKCTNGDCVPVAGGQTAACVPGDGACLPGSKALRCKSDGTGYEQSDCPPNTYCMDRGQCKGSMVVGSSTCSADRKSLTISTDGYHTTTTNCAANEYCVTVNTVPFNQAACKPSSCKPTVAGATCPDTAVCGDPSNPNNDQTKYVATCQETPNGWTWVGTTCLPGQTCSPTGSYCGNTLGGKYQAGCTGNTCTEGTTRCSLDGLGVQVCGNNGTWGATTQCNFAGGDRCITLFGTTKQVCGNPVCSFSGSGTCDEETDGFRACDDTGHLTAAQQCVVGRCQPFTTVTGIPFPFNRTGRCVAECTPGGEDCYLGGASYRTCDATSRWSGPKACPTPDGAYASCGTYTDSSNGLTKHACSVGTDCVPTSRRCINVDGGTGTEGVQICGANGQWGAATTCAVGACISGTCVADCIPDQEICDPTGTGMFYKCPANGKRVAAPVYDQACGSGTTCKIASGRSFGCVQCVGPNLVDGVYLALSEARCLSDDGGLGSYSLQTCKTDNTWEVATPCPGSLSGCVTSFNQNPVVDPGGVRYAYCQ